MPSKRLHLSMVIGIIKEISVYSQVFSSYFLTHFLWLRHANSALIFCYISENHERQHLLCQLGARHKDPFKTKVGEKWPKMSHLQFLHLLKIISHDKNVVISHNRFLDLNFGAKLKWDFLGLFTTTVMHTFLWGSSTRTFFFKNVFFKKSKPGVTKNICWKTVIKCPKLFMIRICI